MPSGDFTSAYDEHVWHVYGYFAYRLRSRADAEDLTQQTFERALRAWPRYDPVRAGVATWLMAIAHNQLVDHLRSDPRAWQQPVDDFADDVLEGAPDRHRIGLDPDLERALAALGDREREIVALRFGGDLNGPEIAALLGLTLANVQQILSRSLRRMRALLDAVPTTQGS